MSRKVIITLPPDLERHVEDVDGRKLPSLVVEELRKAWFPEVVEMTTVATGEVFSIRKDDTQTFNPPIIYSSIPSERKDG